MLLKSIFISSSSKVLFPKQLPVSLKGLKSNIDFFSFTPLHCSYLWRRKWQPTPVFLPGESHGQRSLVDYSPRGRKDSDKTEQLTQLQLSSYQGHFTVFHIPTATHSILFVFLPFLPMPP